MVTLQNMTFVSYENQLCISATDYYSAIKRNEALIHTTTWLNLKNTTLSESHRHNRTNTVWFPVCEMSRTGKSTEQKQISNCQKWEWGQWGDENLETREAVVAQCGEGTNAHELYTLKCLIVCHMNFTFTNYFLKIIVVSQKTIWSLSPFPTTDLLNSLEFPDRDDRSIFCLNEVAFCGPPDSFGTGLVPTETKPWVEAQNSQPHLQPLGRGEGLRIKLITNGQ